MGVSGAFPSGFACALSAADSISTGVATAARPAMVGLPKSCFGLTRRPARRALDTTWMLIIESPPRAKKSSFTPILSSFRTSLQISSSFFSASVPGATYSSPETRSSRPGNGSAFLSTLPCSVSGISSSRTISCGTMYSGSSCARNDLSSSFEVSPAPFDVT